MVRRLYDLTGMQFGRLRVLEKDGTRMSGGVRRSVWLCVCSCGEKKSVIANQLNSNSSGKNTRSCGCLQKERQRENALRLKFGNRRTHSDEEAVLRALYAESKNTSKRRSREFDLTLKQFESLIKKSCFYCGVAPKPKRRVVTYTNKTIIANGIDRVDSSLGYIVGNCVPCCIHCNRAKSDRSFDEWVTHIKMLASRLEVLCVDGRKNFIAM